MPRIRRWELAYEGIFGESGTKVTAQDLQEVVETFAGRVPLTPGHNLADFLPALGFITELSYNPKTTLLVGERIELSDLIDEAFEKKMYGNWSIGVRRRASDGKKYLHHLAVLGAQPPGIKDLRDLTGMPFINMSDDAGTEERWTFKLSDATENWKFGLIGNIFQRLRDRLIEDKGVDEADKIVNKWEIDEISRPEESGNENGSPDEVYAADKQKEDRTMDKETQSLVAGSGQGGANTKVDGSVQLADAQQRASSLEAALRATKRDALQTAAKGKVPADKMPLLLQLADAMPVEENIELTDAAGAKKSTSALDLLTRIFSEMAFPVKPGEMDMGDAPGGQREADVDPNKLIAKM